MAGEGKTTTDHKVIQEWAEERRGRPATVRGTGDGDDPGLLRINFPGYRGRQTLEDITWEEFFEKFDEKGLAFLYQEQTAGGKPSRFFKLISRETGGAKDKAGGGRSRGGKTADKAGAGSRRRGKE